MTTLPSITTKQQEILKLIYRYRFLNRTQIQTLLKHKDKRRIISWLKDLREKQYVDWRYDATNFIAKSQPAIYYLSINGIRYLRETGEYSSEELRKRYKEPGRTQVFIDRCLLIADCCIVLQTKSTDELDYSYVLPADYADPDSPQHFLNELKPHLFFAKRHNGEAVNYALENFELTLPRYQLRQRIKDYVEYIDIWDEENGSAPIALFICATTADLLYVKRRAKKQIEESGNDDIVIRAATFEKVKATGVASAIWEDT
ncbi:MAG: replication-relaxation family protein [Candidatus Woesebacteria bacterium]|jgi:hypothetical protein